ncbi:hypothetical protein AAE478_003391 [Parahypoxylon ruwenzoriense]
MARRSARIASASKRAAAPPAPKMRSVYERNELAEAQTTPSLYTIASSPMPQPATPAVATPVRLPMSEMHPSKVHPTTAAPSSGLKLGFVDIDYTKAPSEQISATQATPSKTPLAVPSSDFTFRQNLYNGDMGLGPAAKQLMDELREDAARIKADLTAQRDQDKLDGKTSNDARKIRQAKGKADRFSAAHMAEFKKMDSIEGHPSILRYAPGRVTPLKAGVKRTQSKANLDDSDSVQSKKISTHRVPTSEKQGELESPPVKRVRQRLEDDASSFRPVSRDNSFLPRTKSNGNDSLRSGIPRSQTLANLMTPTKSSLARTGSIKTPTVTLLKSPSKPDLSGLAKSSSKPDLASLARSSSKKGFGGLKKSLTTNNLNTGNLPAHVQTPGRFDRVKSILKRQLGGSKSKSSIPQFIASPSKTSLHQLVDKELPPAPLTTPGRKLQRRVNFTPMSKPITMLLNTPSPIKSGIPRSKAMARLQVGNSTVDKSANSDTSDAEVAYPDLSAYCRDIDEDTEKPSKDEFPEPVPGTFTFRSDHTIRFDGSSPKGFGSGIGQASLRHVRGSILPTSRMPGSFPRPSDASPNKENKEPVVGPGIPHGMSNKKRHRASWDEEEDEGSKRAAKKLRKEPPAEGHAVVAPRLANTESPIKKPSVSGRTPSPQKKKTGLSLSRLNMLARPKNRK